MPQPGVRAARPCLWLRCARAVRACVPASRCPCITGLAFFVRATRRVCCDVLYGCTWQVGIQRDHRRSAAWSRVLCAGALAAACARAEVVACVAAGCWVRARVVRWLGCLRGRARDLARLCRLIGLAGRKTTFLVVFALPSRRVRRRHSLSSLPRWFGLCEDDPGRLVVV